MLRGDAVAEDNYLNEMLDSSDDDDSLFATPPLHPVAARQNRGLDNLPSLRGNIQTKTLRSAANHGEGSWIRRGLDIPLGGMGTARNKNNAFLHLPREVRQMIYDHLFEDFTLCKLSWNSHRDGRASTLRAS